MLIARVRMSPKSQFIAGAVDKDGVHTDDPDAPERSESFYVRVDHMTLDFISGPIMNPDMTEKRDPDPVIAFLQSGTVLELVEQDAILGARLDKPTRTLHDANQLVDHRESIWRARSKRGLDWLS